MIKLYIYSLLNNQFLYEDIGSIDVILSSLGRDKGFTIIRPPNDTQPWYWIDSKWTKDDTAN